MWLLKADPPDNGIHQSEECHQHIRWKGEVCESASTFAPLLPTPWMRVFARTTFAITHASPLRNAFMAIHLTRDCHGFTHKEARFVPYLEDLILPLRFTDYQK